MPRIETYEHNEEILDDDILIGSSSGSGNQTKNFRVGDIISTIETRLMGYSKNRPNYEIFPSRDKFDQHVEHGLLKQGMIYQIEGENNTLYMYNGDRSDNLSIFRIVDNDEELNTLLSKGLLVEGNIIFKSDSKEYYKIVNNQVSIFNKDYNIFGIGNEGLVPAALDNDESKVLTQTGNWAIPVNTTYSVFTSTVSGLVPAPNEANAAKVLNQLGNWITPPNTTYSAITTAEYNTVIAGNATSTTGRTIAPKMLQDIINNADFNKAKKLSTPRSINGVMFDGTEDITISTGEVYNVFNSTTNGLVPTPNEEGTNKYLNQDGTWKTPTNTTYSLVTQANITAGTETTARLWSVKLMVDNFAKKDHTHTEYSPTDHTHNNYLNTRQNEPNLDIKQKYNVGISSWSDNNVNAPANYGTLLSFTNDGYPHNNSGNWLTHLMFSTDGRMYYANKINNGGYDGPYEVYTTKNAGIADAVNKRHSHGANVPLTVGLVDAISVQPSYNFYYNNASTWSSRLVSLGVNTLQLGHNQSGGRFEFYNGNVYAPAYFTTSLRGYKTNIKEYTENALPLVESLKICTFDRKDSEQENIVGVIADETNPRFLNKELTAVDNYSTMFLMVKAIQELSEEVKQLKQQLNGK